MKKLLTIALVASMGLGAFAQKYELEKVDMSMKHDFMDVALKSVAVSNPHVVTPNPTRERGTSSLDVTQVKMGKSANIWSVLVSAQRALAYNPGAQTIAFTHRGEENEHPGTNGNYILTSWSGDNGSTFDHHMILANDDNINRYPGAQLYNPAGNTNPENVYVVGIGPVTDGSDWVQNFFATATLGDDNHDIQYIDKDANFDAAELLRNGLSVANDGTAFAIAPRYKKQGNLASEMNVARFKGVKSDANNWTWTSKTENVPLAKRTGQDAGTTKNFWEFGGAFSNDGMIGYQWMIGQLESMKDKGGYQPIVWMTQDAGETWSNVAIELEDHDTLAEYLPPTKGVNPVVWPFCTGIDGTVDANGKLQLFITATSHSSRHADSTGYTFTGVKYFIFNVEVNKASGVEQVHFVDSIMGKDVTKKTSAAYCFGAGDNATGWDNRMQVTRSENGQYIGVVWGDTHNAVSHYEGFNAAPDVKASGRAISAPQFADVRNITIDDVYQGQYRFLYTAPIARVVTFEGKQVLVAPVSTSVTLSEKEANDPTAPVTTSLVNCNNLGGVPIPLFEGIEESAEVATEAFTLSQNQPNPFTGTTTITVSSPVVAPVSVEVANIMGQTVMTQSEGTINGSKQITIDASNLQAGIYFYTVRVGANSQTKKMIVK